MSALSLSLLPVANLLARHYRPQPRGPPLAFWSVGSVLTAGRMQRPEGEGVAGYKCDSRAPALFRRPPGLNENRGSPCLGDPRSFSRALTRCLVGSLPALFRRPPGQHHKLEPPCPGSPRSFFRALTRWFLGPLPALLRRPPGQHQKLEPPCHGGPRSFLRVLAQRFLGSRSPYDDEHYYNLRRRQLLS